VSGHTPGPWHVGGIGGATAKAGKTDARRVWAADAAAVCDISTRRLLGAKSAPEEDANARLIAAAPELLEALEIALRYVRSEGSGQEIEQCIDAIAKATGDVVS
jgi:hypothetical protein